MRSTAKPKILLTGGLGFIGTKIVSRLLDSHEILVVDNVHPQVHPDRRRVNELPAGVSFIEGDVTQVRVMAEAAEFAPKVVVHLAAETGTGQSLRQSRRHTEVNVTGTATLLDALTAANHFPARIILPSSRAVYGEGKWTDARTGAGVYANARSASRLASGNWRPTACGGAELFSPIAHDSSSTEPRPSNVYAATKLAQEHVALAWCNAFDVPLAVLRLQNVYGSGQSVGNPYTGVLTFMARQALSGKPIAVFEGGGIIRDFVDVEDVADAIVAAIDFSGADLRADIGSGRPTPLLEVAELLSSLAGGPRPIITSEYRLGDVRAASANIDIARTQLDFTPSRSLEDGLTALLAWVDGEQT